MPGSIPKRVKSKIASLDVTTLTSRKSVNALRTRHLILLHKRNDFICPQRRNSEVLANLGLVKSGNAFLGKDLC